MLIYTVLEATEYCNSNAHVMMLPPAYPNHQRKCNGCCKYFDIRHTVIFSKGGLVIECHNEVNDELLYLSQRAFPSESACNEPIIHQGLGISERDILKGSDILDTKGDLIIWGLWYRHTNTIIDVRLGHTDADNYRFDPMVTLHYWWDKIKQDNNGKHFHEQQKYFLISFFMLMAF